MRDLIVTENITLDGVVDADGGWFQPAGEPETDQSDALGVLRAQMAAADAFLVGRVTFEQMRGYWPEQTDDATGIAAYLNTIRKYVVSGTLTDPGWEPTTVLRGDPMTEIRALKEAQGRDIVVTGSVRLARALVGSGLVDEYRLFVYPVALGRGRRLFPDGVEAHGLRLAESRPFRSGVVLLRYRTRA
ncbi:dihydrofolate reductase [Streptomyces sp. RKND-216]|uniref:dihydrofolate reductase family protein n=1 Tax=Streptomyces sp. RKND-216 TaxID=2562581 RepID=UPI00109DA0FE|nr:dihydrofolate reductase family protein [Streptomyces sp. RKND-216]THA23753.1 dihydrofolate reductase [Streptomyces sp. RKND-216]